jgi:hypothetical protein
MARSLTGNRCQCPTCGEYFNGTQPFDRHRTGDYANADRPNTRGCLTVAEMEAAGFLRNAAGFWCERASAEHATRPRAPVFPAHRAPKPRASLPPYPNAPDSRARMAGAP